jgi:hypothetical protein
MSTVAQRKLSEVQIDAFQHDLFASEQADHFLALTTGAPINPQKRLVDVGGGCGHFARLIQHKTGLSVRVIDSDRNSLALCRSTYGGEVEAIEGDALNPLQVGDEGVVCFNLILHHIIGATESETLNLQRSALNAWDGHAEFLFVNEYAYDSFIPRASGWLIYQITKSRALSFLASVISRYVPSLKANTFGVGVRFRANEEWASLFQRWGYDVVATVRGAPERISLARRLLLIRVTSRDSFLLRRAGD